MANQRPPPPPALSANPAPPRAGGGSRPAQCLPLVAPARRATPALGDTELHRIRDAGLAAALAAPLRAFPPPNPTLRGPGSRPPGLLHATTPVPGHSAHCLCARAQCACAGSRAAAGATTWSRVRRAAAANWLRRRRRERRAR